MRPFEPFFRNRHLSTLAGNFWPRDYRDRAFPESPRWFQTEPDVAVLGIEQQPAGPARGRLILLHGLEGSHESGYMRSLAQTALEGGWAVTRLNMRTCGGTESRCPTLYHAGLTSDLAHVVDYYAATEPGPVFLVGFSLGGNVVLKLAGERGPKLGVDGVAAISTPIDLDACCRHMMRAENRLYEWRFVSRLRDRYRRRCADHPQRYHCDGIDRVRSVYEFDDRFTAPHFGFGSAARYYATQSSQNFLGDIRVPTLLVQAQDDPLIPFAVYERAEIRQNPAIQLLAPSHGGHVGFISRRTPRFWVDLVIADWLSAKGRC
ncbi:MAG: alpha/beta fold hydrolase [Bryobacteraceae bacterium]|nr:alpha/beta fold hydrolase [Bryobacteraceae bacterium]